MTSCKHESPSEEWCVPCQLEPPRGALRWFVNPRSKVAGVVLSAPNYDGTVRVMLLDEVGTIRSSLVPEELVVFEEPFVTRPDGDKRGLIVRALAIAYASGRLFAPKHELAVRELSSEGPSHCWKCKRIVSYNVGSVGCLQCNYYVCVCGNCVCGLDPGRQNYLRKYMPAQPPPPCKPIIRKEYVRIAKKLNDPGFVDLGYKPPQGWRKGLDPDLMEFVEKYLLANTR